MLATGEGSLLGRIENIELTHVGQAFKLGRYPIHFHMAGNRLEQMLHSFGMMLGHCLWVGHTERMGTHCCAVLALLAPLVRLPQRGLLVRSAG